MEELINSFNVSLSSKSLKDTMKEYFNFPDTSDFVIYVKSQLETMIFHEKVDQSVLDFYGLLSSLLTNPQLMEEDNRIDYDEMEKLLTVDKLDTITGSVTYVDGSLKYSINSRVREYLLGDSFWFDSLTSFTGIISLLNSIIKDNPKASFADSMKKRIKALKSLNGVVGGMKTSYAMADLTGYNKGFEQKIIDDYTVFIGC